MNHKRNMLSVCLTICFFVMSLPAQDIYKAVRQGNLERVKSLLRENTSQLNFKNNDGDTPLHIAVLKGYIDIVKFLLTQNPDLEIKNNRGVSDFYISFRDNNGEWSGLKNMGEPVNSDHEENCPALSPDGKYFFFNRRNVITGKSNIYWVDAKIIEELRPK